MVEVDKAMIEKLLKSLNAKCDDVVTKTTKKTWLDIKRENNARTNVDKFTHNAHIIKVPLSCDMVQVIVDKYNDGNLLSSYDDFMLWLYAFLGVSELVQFKKAKSDTTTSKVDKLSDDDFATLTCGMSDEQKAIFQKLL